MESRGRAWLGGGGAWAGAARDASRAGGWGMLTDTRIAAPRQRAQRRSEPSGEVIRRRPATGNRTPTPSEHARQGSPAGGSYKSWPQRKKAIQHCRRPTRILHRARGSVACTGLSQKMVSWPVVACPGGGQSPNPGSSGSKMSRTGRKTCSKRGRRADAQ